MGITRGEIAAWLAGLIDADGTITVVDQRGQQDNYIRPFVNVSNTDRRLLDTITERSGAGVVYGSGKRRKKNHKVCYAWRLRPDEMREWLPLMLPWLVRKREQAELLIEFLTITKANALDPARAKHNRKEQILKRVRELNGRTTPGRRVGISS